jgi:hypothetical protein
MQQAMPCLPYCLLLLPSYCLLLLLPSYCLLLVLLLLLQPAHWLQPRCWLLPLQVLLQRQLWHNLLVVCFCPLRVWLLLLLLWLALHLLLPDQQAAVMLSWPLLL